MAAELHPDYAGFTPNQIANIVGSAIDAFAITPHNDNELKYITRGLLIKGSGNVNVVTAKGTTIALPVIDGYYPVMVKKVLVTDTTAGLTIIGLV